MTVIDASIAMAWILPDEHSEAADSLRHVLVAGEALAPWFWWVEVRNVLIVAERRNRIEVGAAETELTALSAFPISFDHEPEERALLNLARAHQLSVYDALYLELARRKGSMLATLDKRLAAACRVERVNLAL